MKDLHMSPGSRDVVARVLEEGSRCIEEGVPYCADRKLKTADDFSACLIQRGSADEQIVADCIERGGSYRIAAAYVNDYRNPLGLTHIGISAVSWIAKVIQDDGVLCTALNDCIPPLLLSATSLDLHFRR